jgi:hypothetical protein
MEAGSPPDMLDENDMTPAGLAGLRKTPATLADSPIARLKAHLASHPRDCQGGIAPCARSTLAQLLSRLEAEAARSSSPKLHFGATLDVRYRIREPARCAAQVGGGIDKRS